MVYLSRIYTKTGDAGETSLGDGSRVPKDHLRVATYGTVDELNSVLGLLLTLSPPEADLLRSIQNDLFDLGADLCVPSRGVQASDSAEVEPVSRLRVQPQQSTRLEQAIDRLNAGLQPLTSFILPGGSGASAWCHLARTVCRRAEREVVTLARVDGSVNPAILIYLNRLSDLLFVLARVYNNNGAGDILWQPGLTRSTSTGPGTTGTGTSSGPSDPTTEDVPL